MRNEMLTSSEQRELCAFLRRKNDILSLKEAHMTSIADGAVQIQTSPESVASPPSWFGEVVLRAAHLRQQGILSQISERVRFARRRFGHDEVIDFLAVLAGLCHQWGTHPASVLRETPALCGSLHGPV
jgi:hypothetical protein